MLLISDLHLEAGREDITRTLLDLLQRARTGTRQLFILGDLFEVWVGDDDDDPLPRRIIAALRQLSEAGVEILLLHGNRDFLLGQQFARLSGATLLNDPHVMEFRGERIALMHGDSLCIDDTGYQQFRRQVRDPAWQREFLARPLAERREFAREARRRSMVDTRNKAEAIMDVNPDEVIRVMQGLGVTTLIHGHTHRPAIHRVELANGGRGQRIVLGDWDRQGWQVADSADGLRLSAFPLVQANA